MDGLSSRFGFFLALALLSSACGGNVVLDGSGAGGTAGAGGTSGTATSPINWCEKLTDDLVAAYEACGITVTVTSSTTCSASDALLAQCLDKCVAFIDCPCFNDPTGLGCNEKIAIYSDCINGCPSGN